MLPEKKSLEKNQRLDVLKTNAVCLKHGNECYADEKRSYVRCNKPLLSELIKLDHSSSNY